jgi:hypothetical protein
MISTKFKKSYFIKNKGQVMLTMVILFMGISLIIVFGLINPVLRNIRVPADLFKSKQSLFLADSGIADAVYRVKSNLHISNQEYLPLNNFIATTSIVDTLEGKTITSASNYLDYIRNTEVRLIKGTGASFFYGVQTGEGGFFMDGSAEVEGNVYSNGIIEGGTITGTAVSAGETGSIIDTSVGENAQAHTISDSVVSGLIKCKIDDHTNNKACDTSFADPAPLEMPITANQITEWKAEAEAERIITGNYSPTGPVTLGPVRITGNFDVKNKITMTGTIWVEGVISFGGQGSIILATSTYGNKSGVIIVDKYTNFSGGSQIVSTGVTGSYVMLLVTSDCPISSFCSGKNAISASGHAGSVVLAAPYGTVDFTGGSGAKEVMANKIILGGSSSIVYDTGLASMTFVSGPAGGYHVISFREVE